MRTVIHAAVFDCPLLAATQIFREFIFTVYACASASASSHVFFLLLPLPYLLPLRVYLSVLGSLSLPQHPSLCLLLPPPVLLLLSATLMLFLPLYLSLSLHVTSLSIPLLLLLCLPLIGLLSSASTLVSANATVPVSTSRNNSVYSSVNILQKAVLGTIDYANPICGSCSYKTRSVASYFMLTGTNLPLNKLSTY